LSLDLDQHPARHDPQATADASRIGYGIDHSEALSTTLNVRQIVTPPRSRGQISSPDEGQRNTQTRRVWSSGERRRETSHGGGHRLHTSDGVREKHGFGRGTGPSRMTSPLLGQKSTLSPGSRSDRQHLARLDKLLTRRDSLQSWATHDDDDVPFSPSGLTDAMRL